MNGLSVMSVNGTHHAILLVSDLDSADLAELSRAVSVPLARRLDVSLMPNRGILTSVAPLQLLRGLPPDSSRLR
jgi:hypothetical protein